LSDEQTAEAERRRAIVLSLEGKGRLTGEDVKRAAREFGCSVAQLNRYRRAYRQQETLTCLLPLGSDGGRGKLRLQPSVEAVIIETIAEYDRSKPNAKDHLIIKEIRFRCRTAKLPEPSFNTLRSRLSGTPLRQRATDKYGRKHARDHFDPAIGTTPETTSPLQRIQIDHTLADVVCTGEEDREHIGRPWFTVAIDEHTRAILGFVLSWEYPNAATLALLLTRVMLPKDEWLRERGLTDVVWPMYGKPDLIYVDNAKELNSKEIYFGCNQHNMPPPETRPGGTPHWGGIIERYIGNAMDKLRLLKGSTADQKGFDRDKTSDPNETAEMSLLELERWLIYEIAKYHLEPHTGINDQRPDKAWERGIYGTERRTGRGPSVVPADKLQVFLDFAPMDYRTIQRYGVLWNNIPYWGEALRPFLAAGDGRKFVVKRNPYDLSVIWLKNPDGGLYHELRSTRPIRSQAQLWEWREASRKLKAQGDKADQESIDSHILQQRAIEQEARNKKANWKRRKRQERRAGGKRFTAEIAPAANDRDDVAPTAPLAAAAQPRPKPVFRIIR
jgi:putative transposase